jgi:hypothetical protein
MLVRELIAILQKRNQELSVLYNAESLYRATSIDRVEEDIESYFDPKLGSHVSERVIFLRSFK